MSLRLTSGMLVIPALIASYLAGTGPGRPAPQEDQRHAGRRDGAARDRATYGAGQPTWPLRLVIYDETSPKTAARGCAARCPSSPTPTCCRSARTPPSTASSLRTGLARVVRS